MSEKTPQSYIYLARPELIKEWHPTKNGKSNPRNVTCDHGEEVWWLCEKGHEWKATVKSRTEGNRCPACETELVKEQSQKIIENLQQQKVKSHYGHVSEKSSDLFQADSNNYSAWRELRKYKRYKCTATAMLKNVVSESSVYAQVQNISDQGIYFETNAAFKPGVILGIELDKPLLRFKSKSFTSIVRWCKALTDEEGYTHAYGLGAKFN